MEKKKLLQQSRYVRFVALLAIIHASPDTFLSQSRCPRISIECSSPDNCCNGPFEFTVRLTGGEGIGLVSYNWSISAGRIVSGQGTPAIKVDSTGWGGQTVTATVEVKGLEASCSGMASATQVICEDPPPARLVYRYSKVSFAKENSILNGFAAQLRNDPGTEAYILARRYHRRSERAKKYLIAEHGIEADRIVIVESNRGNRTIELYVVPVGAIPPKHQERERGPGKVHRYLNPGLSTKGKRRLSE